MDLHLVSSKLQSPPPAHPRSIGGCLLAYSGKGNLLADYDLEVDMRFPSLEQFALFGVCLIEAVFFFILWRLHVVLLRQGEQPEIEYDTPPLRIVRPAAVDTKDGKGEVVYGEARVARDVVE